MGGGGRERDRKVGRGGRENSELYYSRTEFLERGRRETEKGEREREEGETEKGERERDHCDLCLPRRGHIFEAIKDGV